MVRATFLVILLISLYLADKLSACPTNETLSELCKCESTFNGILLDCSSESESEPSDSNSILRMLQENRAQLGLIQELLLRNGTLRQLSANMFDGLYVKKLDLSSNRIENVSSDAFRGLENVLQILIVSRNRLSRFPAPALSNMLALLQLDLSENQIGDLQETDSLRNAPKLFDLNLSNNKICNIHKQSFDDVKQSIQTLNLGGNCFDRVPAAAVRGFKRLLALHLHNNRIEQLEPLQFMNLPSLNLINLARNRIETVHRQSFLNVPNLRFMYLSDNNISQLEPNQFRTFENLELLDLTRNRIRTLPASAFVNMPRLTQLYLGENGVETIEGNAFQNGSLQILLLPNNRLTELRADMFNGLTYLQQFSLKGNKISRIASNAFYQMPSLVVVDLSDNELNSLEPATFLAQLNLFLLDLSRNKLTSTPHNAFNRRIVTVVLQDNPLVCTERVHVLQNGVGVNVPGTVDNVCGGGSTKPTTQTATTTPTASFSLSIDPESSSASTDIPAFVQESPATEPAEAPATVAPASLRPLTIANRPSLPNLELKTSRPVLVNPLTVGRTPIRAVAAATPPVDLTPFQPIPITFPIPDDQTDGFVPVSSAGNDNFFPPPFQTAFPSDFFQTQTPIPASFVPGIVEQVPLDETHENQGPPQVSQESSSQQQQTPEFAWTWPISVPPSPRPAPSKPIISPTPVTATLPPDVITAPSTPALPELKTSPSKKHRPSQKEDPSINSDAVAAAGNDLDSASASGANATTTIAVCLTVVVVVMISVFVTLCVVRHRNRHTDGGQSVSSASRTSAYVAAQAAQHRMNYAQSTYGVSPATMASQQNQAWIYAPGTYASPSTYYK